MKKWISIVLLLLYLVSTTDLNQFLKLPILIEHYTEHKALNPQMTIVSFVKMHYDHPVKDADYKTDRKLPFVIHSTLSVVFTLTTDFNFQIDSTFVKHQEVHIIPAFDEDFHLKGHLHSIWQPPRFS